MRGSSAWCCGAPAAGDWRVSVAHCRRRTSLSLRYLSVFCLIIFATTATTASSLPINCGSKGPLGGHTRPLPYACISNTLASLRSAWRGLWDRATSAAAEGAADIAPVAAHLRLPSSTKALRADEEELTRAAAAAAAAEAAAAAVALRHVKPRAAADSHGRAHEAATSAAADSVTASAQAASVAAAEEHQRDIWRQKTAAEIKRPSVSLGVAAAAVIAAAAGAAFPRRLVFTPASLKQRGWLAFRRSDPTRPLPCLLYAAVPPGRLAVAPAANGSSSNNDSTSDSSSGRREEDIPWVSFIGLARLNRANPLKVKSLWFALLPFPSRAVVASLSGVLRVSQVLLVRFLLDHKPAVPCLLVAACCGSAIAAREPLSRFLLSLLLSSSVWRRYALWSPVLHAPPALALLLLRLLLHGARTAGQAATAACRKGLEELEAALLEASVVDNFPFNELAEGVPTTSHVAASTPPA
ncbi:hypothetical protein ACSSS7_007190 [Eimeria intestinalis]